MYLSGTKEYMDLSVNSTCIREARYEDMEDICQLLCAEGVLWKQEQVEENLSRFIMLVCGKKLIAVLAGRIYKAGIDCEFIAVHPGYPENSVASALQGLVTDVYARPQNY